MSIQVKVKAGETPDFSVTLSREPNTVEIPQSKGLSVLILSFLLAILLVIFLDLSLALPLIGGLFLFLALRYFFDGLLAPDRITFEKTQVTVSEFGIFKRNIWTRPYRDFEGVILYQKSALTDQGNKAGYFIIELKHRDKTKTLPLFVRRDTSSQRKKLKQYAHFFNLPAFD